MVPWLAKYANTGPLKAADAFREAPGPGTATKAAAKRAAAKRERVNRVRVFLLSVT